MTSHRPSQRRSAASGYGSASLTTAPPSTEVCPELTPVPMWSAGSDGLVFWQTTDHCTFTGWRGTGAMPADSAFGATSSAVRIPDVGPLQSSGCSECLGRARRGTVRPRGPRHSPERPRRSPSARATASMVRRGVHERGDVLDVGRREDGVLTPVSRHAGRPPLARVMALRDRRDDRLVTRLRGVQVRTVATGASRSLQRVASLKTAGEQRLPDLRVPGCRCRRPNRHRAHRKRANEVLPEQRPRGHEQELIVSGEPASPAYLQVRGGDT